MIRIRPALLSDIDNIMALERETFGEVSDEAMATREMMESRITLCNTEAFIGFLVAEYEGKIVGDMIFQPTHMDPHECTSWPNATDNGDLTKTFNIDGDNIYIVSLAASYSAPPGTTYLLAHETLLTWLNMGKKYYMFCSRMPGFRGAHEKDGISAEDYWQLKKENGKPQDWMIQEYYKMSNAHPFRLLKNGFPPDKDSGGHGVLFALDDPLLTLQTMALCIYDAGVSVGEQLSKGEE